MAGAGEEMGTDIIADGASNSINLRRPDVNSRATLGRRTDDEISAIAGLDAWRVQAGEIGLSFAPQTSFSLQRVPSGWILTHTGQEGVQITLDRAFKDMIVSEKGADRPLITTKHEGTQTFVLDDDQEYMIRPSEADRR